MIVDGFAGRFYGGLLYPHPTWREHSEFFESPHHARAVFEYRLSIDGKAGRRMPPRLVRWNRLGEPELSERTLGWSWPSVDDQAWMEIVHLPGTHLDLIEGQIYQTIKLIVRGGRVLPEGSPS